jgi:hypothetical protein
LKAENLTAGRRSSSQSGRLGGVWEAVAMLVHALPAGHGPAVKGTAEDL